MSPHSTASRGFELQTRDDAVRLPAGTTVASGIGAYPWHPHGKVGYLRRMINHLLLAATLATLTGGCGESPAAERAARVSRSQAPAGVGTIDGARLDSVYARAAELPPLRSLLVFQRDTLRREQYFHGARAEQPANIKSASKSVIAALVGVAIARGDLHDVRQPLSELLPVET